MDVSMDIHVKSVLMDIYEKLHIHGKPGNIWFDLILSNKLSTSRSSGIWAYKLRRVDTLLDLINVVAGDVVAYQISVNYIVYVKSAVRETGDRGRHWQLLARRQNYR